MQGGSFIDAGALFESERFLLSTWSKLLYGHRVHHEFVSLATCLWQRAMMTTPLCILHLNLTG
jgi:hypothetical protein